MMSPREQTEKPRRADAQENRRHLLEVANKVFMKEGPDASLEEIARRAEVGIGTLYRHFPTRSDLIEEVYAEQIEVLISRANELADTLSPKEALTAWLRALAEHTAKYKALKACLLAVRNKDGVDQRQWKERLRAAAGRLLSAAEKAGAVRPGLDPV
ncbi:MAG TPA: helix-turn-helix domain-containing protein, partial [Spirochaetia bacterium]|nr:helix-turn-helix domain-containing protein [Spirochaetia bacterium]